MKLADILVLAAILLVAGVALFCTIRQKKKGGCAGCPHCGGCSGSCGKGGSV